MNEALPVSLEDFKRALMRVKEEQRGIQKVTVNGEQVPVSADGTADITLPVATAEKAGTIIAGSGLNVEPDGTASVDMSQLSPEAVEAIAEKVLPSEGDMDTLLAEQFQPWKPET